MKKMVFLLLFSVSCFAQVNNFIVKNNSLIWETVFISNETNIPQLLQRHPRLNVISSENNIYKGTGTEIRNTCPGASAFMDNEFSFDFEIELREGKYRVTITNIKFTLSGNSKKKPAVKNAENYLVENGAVKAGEATQQDLMCFETFFNRLFTVSMSFRNKS
jgi:hypothetical protein